MAASVHAARVTGVVLAGGLGRRMGGRDKGLEPFRGRPLVAHVVARLRPQVATLVVSANRHASRYAAFAERVIPDVDADRLGPLAGLRAALRSCETPYLVAVPCDVPFLPIDLVATLGAALDDPRVDVAYATTAMREHPVFCLVRIGVAGDLDAYLDGGGRAVRGWLATQATRAVSFADESAFRNLNTPDDLRDADG